MKHVPRFYISNSGFVGDSLAVDAIITLHKSQMHHAINVLRMAIGDHVRIFNEHFGEWDCSICDVKKNTLICNKMISTPYENDQHKNVEIAFSLIHQNRISILLEKITELGVTKIFLLKSQHSQYKNVNMEKLQQIVVGACEQCGRIDIPKIFPPENLQDFLKKHEGKTTLLVADEKSDENSKKMPDLLNSKYIFIVGPEGGFSDEERALFDQSSSVERISLGKRILRSETAAIICVASQSIWSWWSQGDSNP